MFAIILNVFVAVIGVITIGCAVWEFIKNRGKWKFAYITMGIGSCKRYYCYIQDKFRKNSLYL